MLPGIRFLLAATILSMSVLIFGLGAAALLRAAHEEVANIPARRAMPEPVFAQQADPPATLAMLRVEPGLPEKALDAPPAAMPPPEPAPEAVPVPEVETEQLAALQLDDVATAEAVTPEPAATAAPAATAETGATAEIAAKPETAATEAPAPLPAATEPPPAAETKLSALDAPTSPPAEVVPIPFELIAPPAMTDASLRTKTAALGDAAVKVEKPVEAKASEKSDRSEALKKQRAERARERRRQAARRARLAAQQAAVQQVADPFAQLTQPALPATTATTRRRQ